MFFIAAMLLTVGVLANPFEKRLFKDKLSIVPELGMNSSTLSKTSTHANFGFNIGVGLRFGKRKHLYTGIYYKTIRYEATIDTSGASIPTFREVNSSYLVVPLMYGLTPIKTRFFDLRLFGGAAAFLNQTGEVKGLSSIKPSDTVWNLRAGAGINIWKIECNFSYDLGLTRMFTTVSDDKCHGYNLTVGYRF